MARILVVAYTDLARDPRVSRQIDALAGEHEVIAAGIGAPRADVEFHDIDPGPEGQAASVRRRAIGLPAMAARRYGRMHWDLPINRRAREVLDGVRPDLVLANDLETLPVAFAVAHGAPVMLDEHEHAPSVWAARRAWRIVFGPYVDWLCRTYLPRVAAMTTVSEGIADLYARDYGVRARVVTNATAFADLEPTPTPTDRPLRLIHHGVAQEPRKLEWLVEAIGPLAGRFELDLMLALGSPAYLERLRALAATTTNIRVIDPQPLEGIVPALHAYDVGVHIIPNATDHERLALPNKYFEFVQARLGLIVGPSPDVVRLFAPWGCALVTAEPSPAALRDVLESLDAAQVDALKAGSHAAARTLSAEANAGLVREVVAEALRYDSTQRTTSNASA